MDMPWEWVGRWDDRVSQQIPYYWIFFLQHNNKFIFWCVRMCVLGWSFEKLNSKCNLINFSTIPGTQDWQYYLILRIVFMSRAKDFATSGWRAWKHEALGCKEHRQFSWIKQSFGGFRLICEFQTRARSNPLPCNWKVWSFEWLTDRSRWFHIWPYCSRWLSSPLIHYSQQRINIPMKWW